MSINYKRIGLANNELSSIQVFRENERLLHDFFNNPHITNQNKLNEWKRIKEYEMKHIGAEEIDAADQLRKLSRDPAIATKRGHLSQCGIVEQDHPWVATHTDRLARGEESRVKPGTKKELGGHLSRLYDLCHTRALLTTPRIQEQFARAIEDLETVIRIRILENTLFENVRFGLVIAFHIYIEAKLNIKEISSVNIAKRYDITQKTAWEFLNKIKSSNLNYNIERYSNEEVLDNEVKLFIRFGY